ncbi:unnamed protein product [Gongylonema pulchrum]|uniref:Uncharacterized protein n=1 Tax=Gongylonema pulchrum TaxID=637853 RepID=A0A183EGY1_9BILA|nr:unnamed protein product [Gongylonema pulchrum]
MSELSETGFFVEIPAMEENADEQLNNESPKQDDQEMEELNGEVQAESCNQKCAPDAIREFEEKLKKQKKKSTTTQYQTRSKWAKKVLFMMQRCVCFYKK